MSISAAAAGRSTLIRGVLTTAGGKAIGGALVEILDNAGNIIARSVSDSKGQFEIETDTPAGAYELVVTNSGQLNAERIQLDRVDLNINLTVSAPPENFNQAHYKISSQQLAISAKTRARITAAQKKIEGGDIPGALTALDAAIKFSPSCSEAWSMRAFVKLSERNAAGAVSDASHAIALDRANAEAYLSLGSAYNSEKDFGRAEASLSRALELRPDSWQAQLELAKAWYGEKRFVLALRQLELVQHDFPDIHLVRANVLISLGRNREGAEEFDSFLQAVPNDRRAPQIRRIIAEIMQNESAGRQTTPY